MSSKHLCSDEFWNTTLAWYSSYPSFTSCFRNTVLAWTPASFLLISSCIYINNLFSQPRALNKKCSIGYVYIAKLFLNIFLVSTGIIDAFTAADSDSISEIMAPIIDAASALIIISVCELARRKGEGNTYIVTFYWILMVLANFEMFYLSFLRNDLMDSFQTVSFYATYSVYIFQFVLSNLNDSQEHTPPDEKQKYSRPCPQIRCSLISFLTFHWITELMYRGNKKELEVDDLWHLNPKFHSERISLKFKNALRENITQLTKNPLRRFAGCIWNCYGFILFRSSILKLFVDTLELSTSLILKLLLDFVSESFDDMWKGYLYVFLIFSVSIIKAMFTEATNYYSQLAGMIIKSGIIATLYDKTLRIASFEKKKVTNGELVNYMALDAERICLVVSSSSVFISTIYLLVASLSLMYFVIGWSVFLGLAVLMLSVPLQYILSRIRNTVQNKQFVKKDKRIKSLNEIFSNIKVLKLYGWENPFADKIDGIRTVECKLLKTYMLLQGVTFALFTSVPALSFLAIILSYSYLADGKLTAATAFMLLSLFNTLNSAIRMLPALVAYTIMAFVSMKRLSKFYGYEDRLAYIEPKCTSPNLDIQLTQATLTYGPKEKPVLKNLSIDIEKKSLNIVIGSVGSGKSSLLNAILGELVKTEGSVRVNGSIAYTSQSPWIQSCSIKENIIFHKTFNKKTYKKVIEACALLPDFEMLGEGENTAVGEKGITLSGGQKHRISLARAVYDNADLYLFDDPLSAVDSHVGNHLFENVFSSESGMLRNKTRVLVTHNLSYLSKADKVIFIVNGEIRCCGKYQELLANQVFADFVETETGAEEDTLDDSSEPKIPKPRQQRKSFKSQSSLSLTLSSEIDQKEIKEISKEKVSQGTIKFDVFLKYVKSFGVYSGMLCLFCCIGGAILGTITELILSSWTTDPLLVDPLSNMHWKNYTKTENTYAIEYVCVFTLQTVLFIAQGFFLARGSFNTSMKFHKELLYRLIKAPMMFFDVTPIGLIINRFSRDIDVIDETILLMIPSLLFLLVSMTLLIVIICFINIYIIALVILLAILFFAVQRFYGRVSRQIIRFSSATKSPIFSSFSELYDGVTIIKTFRKSTIFVQEIFREIDENNIYNYASFTCSSWLGIRVEFIAATIILIVALVSVVYRDPSTAGIFGLVLSRSITLVPILGFVVRSISNLETNSISIERIVEFTEIDNEAEHVLPHDNHYKDWPNRGEINFNEISCKYRDDLNVVLNEISFNIHPQEKIGIVGRTGSGKSTLTLNLFRLYEACNGKVFIDGVNIKTLGLNTVRSKMTILPQDAILFGDTLRFNLDPLNQYTDQQIWDALEQSQLKDFVEELPGELSYIIEEAGKNVSVGQRQLFCLARALLRKSKILVLDEATAAIDVRTDSIIQNTIREKFSGCTILTIAHRLNTILDYDRIMVLDKGRLVQFDSPSVLAKDRDNLFYKLLKDAKLHYKFEYEDGLF